MVSQAGSHPKGALVGEKGALRFREMIRITVGERLEWRQIWRNRGLQAMDEVVNVILVSA